MKQGSFIQRKKKNIPHFFRGMFFRRAYLEAGLDRSIWNFAKPFSSTLMNFMLDIFSANGFASGEEVNVTFTFSFTGVNDQLLSAAGLYLFG